MESTLALILVDIVVENKRDQKKEEILQVYVGTFLNDILVKNTLKVTGKK